MFRIEYLKLIKHPQLGDIELNLSEVDESHNNSKIYTSVIIGPNGTGKSYILKTIADIFNQFRPFEGKEAGEIRLPFSIHLRYCYYGDRYEIVTRSLVEISRKGEKRKYVYFKNRPSDISFKEKGKFFEVKTGFEVPHKELPYPKKLLVNSVIPTDRFVFKDSKAEDFYQYLGARSTRSTSSTRSSSRRTIKHLFRATGNDSDFIQKLKELLAFLGFEESFKVQYKTKINKLFFSGSLTEENFIKYYEAWWHADFEYSDRKKENPLWSVPYYNNNFKGKADKITEIVNFLNRVSTDNKSLVHKKKSRSKIFPVDVLGNDLSINELELISYLENLDILNLDGIKIIKQNSTLTTNDISSGEYHLLISIIGIFSNISQNSIVLIDEPEISLHPNWQMQYITFLKDVFSNFTSCHFIITSHSHFLVSDLEGQTSSVTALKRNDDTNILKADIMDGINTFGWSAEEVLYRIFNIKSTRNAFVEYDLVKLVSMLNRSSREFDEMRRIINKLSQLDLSENDPLNIILEKSHKYLDSQNA